MFSCLLMITIQIKTFLVQAILISSDFVKIFWASVAAILARRVLVRKQKNDALSMACRFFIVIRYVCYRSYELTVRFKSLCSVVCLVM